MTCDESDLTIRKFSLRIKNLPCFLLMQRQLCKVGLSNDIGLSKYFPLFYHFLFKRRTRLKKKLAMKFEPAKIVRKSTQANAIHCKLVVNSLTFSFDQTLTSGEIMKTMPLYHSIYLCKPMTLAILFLRANKFKLY